MEITWRNIDTSGRRFNFETSDQVLGELTLFGPFLSNAHYYTSGGGIRFNKNGGTWPNRMVLDKNGEHIGAVIFGIYSPPKLTLKNGRQYYLDSNIFGRNLRWKNTSGESVVTYTLPTMQSMGRGSISISKSLNQTEADILISTGMVARNYFVHKLSTTAFFVGFALLSAAKLLS